MAGQQTTNPRDTQLPQVTGSPRQAGEVPAVRGPAQEVTAALSETASVEAQLQLIQAAMKEERTLRLNQAAQADVQLADMRRALEAATLERPAEPHSEGWFFAHVVLPLVIAAVIVAVGGTLVFRPEWLGPLLHPWVQDASAVQQPAADIPRETWSNVEAVQNSARVGPPSPESLSEASAEKYELARLNGALDAIPVTAVPTILGSVNEWLWSLGGPPCSVESAKGEVSLVISGRGQTHPLLTALSRCADAVEHFTQP